MKLIDKIKPEILEVLEKDVKIKYSASYELIIATFSNYSNISGFILSINFIFILSKYYRI